MYTPITKRVKVAQHKSSIAKSTEDEKKAKENNKNPTTKKEVVKDKDGNELKATATGNEGTFTPPVAYEGKDACEDPNSDACKEWTSENERCKDPNAEGCSGFKKYETGTTTPGDAKFSYEQPLTEASSGSSIDLFSSQELREASRAGKVGARNVRKASKQYKRMQEKFNKGKITQTVLDAYKNELDNTVSRHSNIGQQAKGMRNRYITQRMEYGRGENLKGAVEGGQPIKAPEGTRTKSEFESEFEKDMGVNSGSTAPQTTTTPTSSFSAMASQNGVSYKPITLDNGALFQGLDSSISAFGNKVKKGTMAFKMKGYGSKR